MSKDINDAVKPLIDAWPKIKEAYEKVKSGYTLVISQSHRDPAEQWELFLKGRVVGADGKVIVQDKAKIVTQIDGKTRLGAHNFKPARAIDVAVKNLTTGAITWSEAYYLPLEKIVSNFKDLEWGGNWVSFKDLPHIQIKNFREYQA